MTSINLSAEIWTAEVVYAGFGTPMLEGGLTVVGEHIAAVGSLKDLTVQFPDAPVIHKGKALTPPVANAHTHLDMSLVPYFRGGYTDFIRHVIANGKNRSPEAATAGLAELQSVGAGAFGDIVYNPAVMEMLLRESPIPGVAYFEVINRDPTKADETLNKLGERIAGWRKFESNVDIGLSPHTPYNLSRELLLKLTQLAKLEGIPLQMHVAESPQEIQLMQNSSGPLFDLPTSFGFPGYTDLPGLTPVRYLAELGVLGPHLSIIHGVQVDEEEVQMLGQSGTKVVSCPRSNEGLECGQMPWGLYLKHGVEVALGTDSRGSAPDLDVKKEALSLWNHIDKRVLVRSATRSGYRVLGLECPRITRGSAVSSVQSWG